VAMQARGAFAGLEVVVRTRKKKTSTETGSSNRAWKTRAQLVNDVEEAHRAWRQVVDRADLDELEYADLEQRLGLRYQSARARLDAYDAEAEHYPGRARREGRDQAGPRVARPTDTNLYVLQEVADAVELYGAPVRRFSPTSAPHLRRLIGFGLLERTETKILGDSRAPGWAPSAAGYAALEERRRAYPALAAATGLRDPDPERRERYVRMLRQEMQP